MVFRRKDKQGKPTGKWIAKYRRIPDGQWANKAVGPNKSVAQEVENDLNRRYTLFQAGLYDPSTELQRAPLEDHLSEFLIVLRGGGIGRRGRPTEAYSKTVEAHLRTMIGHIGAKLAEDLTARALIEFLADLETGDKVKSAKTGEPLRAASPKTRDSYLADAKSFGAWMSRNGRFGPRSPSPFESVNSASREGDETLVRMALTRVELDRLADAAAAAGDVWSRNRRTLYLTAGTTGLRKGECRALTWGRVVFDVDGAFIDISGKQALAAKNRRRAEIPLLPSIAAVLRQEREAQAVELGRPVGARDRVFPAMPKDSHGMARLIREDATAAKLPLVDEEGRKLDFHSLRSTATTILLDAGVLPHQVKDIIRHADVETTMRHYTKLRRSDLRDAIRRVEDGAPHAHQPMVHGHDTGPAREKQGNSDGSA